mgnify:CR=1 FL=1
MDDPMEEARAAAMLAFLLHVKAVSPERAEIVSRALAKVEMRGMFEEVFYWAADAVDLSALIETVGTIPRCVACRTECSCVESQCVSERQLDAAADFASTISDSPISSLALASPAPATPAPNPPSLTPLTEPNIDPTGDLLERAFALLCPDEGASMRDFQAAASRAALGRRDALVVSATGSGKSMCFQLPAVATNRPAIIISPLLSLMEDQVRQLVARGVKACFLGSTQTDAGIERAAFSGEFILIYMSPERLVRSVRRVQELHERRPICLFGVDGTWEHYVAVNAVGSRGVLVMFMLFWY